MLATEFSCLYIHVLYSIGDYDRALEYMKENRSKEHEFNYSLYVHGYFLPWLDWMRNAGQLKKGKSGSHSEGD